MDGTDKTFDFYRPASTDEAIQLHSREGCYFLSGGTFLNQKNCTPKDASTFIYVKDILPRRILRGTDTTSDTGTAPQGSDEGIIIGAGATLQDIADSDTLPKALVTAARFVSSRTIRNMATIGGSIGANLSYSYIIPVLLALETKAILANGHAILIETYINENRKDLILEVNIPPQKGKTGVVKESISSSAYPVVSAAAMVLPNEQTIIAAGCVSDRVIRLSTVENMLTEGKLKERKELEQAVAESISPIADNLGSAEYKEYINSVCIADMIQSLSAE